MPLFFIEMGQGIVAKGDLRVRTSALYTCTLIAGFNQRSMSGGAFHFPACQIDNAEVRRDMETWAAVLRPTEVILIFAPSPAMGLPGGTPDTDKVALRAWVTATCGVVAQERETASGGMSLQGGAALEAGPINKLKANFDQEHMIRLDNHASGTYDQHCRFNLVGRNRER